MDKGVTFLCFLVGYLSVYFRGKKESNINPGHVIHHINAVFDNYPVILGGGTAGIVGPHILYTDRFKHSFVPLSKFEIILRRFWAVYVG